MTMMAMVTKVILTIVILTTVILTLMILLCFFRGPVQQAGETSNGFNSAAALGRHGGHASSVVVHNLARA